MEQTFPSEIHQLQSDVRQLNTKVDRILRHLSGDDLDRDDNGLIGTVRLLEDRIQRLEKWKERVIYFLVGASFAVGYSISDLITAFIHHK